MFNLAALGAGLGEFAQQYRQQQEMQKQSLMLQMQLAHYRQQQEADQRQSQAASLAFGFNPSDLGGGTKPMQAMPSAGGMGGAGGGVSALTGPMPGAPQRPPSMGASGEYGVNQSGLGTLQGLLTTASASLPEGYRAVQTSGSRPGARVAGTGGVSQHALGNAMDIQIIGPDGQPVPNTGDDTTGLYGRLALAMRKAASPDVAGKLGWGGNFTTGPANGPRDLMHFDLAGDRGRFGTLAQMAQNASGQGTSPQDAAGIAGSVAGGLGGQPQIGGGVTMTTTDTPIGTTARPPDPPPEARDIALLLRKNNPNADSRTLIQAAADIHARLQNDYKIQFDRWKATQQIGGEQAGRAETERSHRVTEGQTDQRIRLEGTGQAETERSHRVTEGQTDQRIRLEGTGQAETERSHRVTEGQTDQRIRLEGTGQAETERSHRASEQLGGRQAGETERAHRANEQNAATKVQAAVGKERAKVDLATTELDTLAQEARQLAAMVEADPKLVGAKGQARGLVGGVLEQAGVLDEDPSRPAFKSKILLLQSRLAKPMLSSKYWSGNVQKRMEQLVPALARLDNPTTVVQSLTNIADQLESTSAATKAASGVVSHDVSKLSDDELRQEFGLTAPEK